MAAVTCQEIRELFSARADDALGADERARLDAHLTTCAECAREWQGFERTVGLLRAVAPARAPAGFVERVLTARPRPWYRRLARGLFVPWPIKLPLEAAAIVLVAGLAALVFQRSPELQQGARIAERSSVATAPMADKEQPRPSRGSPVAVSGERTAPPPESKGRTREEAPADARQDLARQTPQRPGDVARADEAIGTVSPPAAPSPDEPPRKSEEARSKNAVDAALEKKYAEAERSGPAAGQVAPAAPSAPQKTGEVQRLAAAVDVQARLAVADPAAAERGVRDVVARAGGHVLARVEDDSTIVLTLTVPGDRWDEAQRGLHTLGTLRLGGRSPVATGALRITLRLER